MKRVAISRIFGAGKPYIKKEILESLSNDLHTCKYCKYNATERAVRLHYRLEHTQEILEEFKSRSKLQETTTKQNGKFKISLYKENSSIVVFFYV